MKKTLHRILAAVLCAVMLTTMLPVFSVTAQTEMPVLAYVPLDDRPVVCDRVQYAATAAGFDVVFPPDKSWYQTHLDNQLVNEDNPDTLYTDERQVGNGAAIMDWLDEMEASGCDHYIIHLDMMFSGGLVGSRFPDTHYDENGYLNISEQLAIAERLAALANNAENNVYFVDTVVRLASTGGFKGYQLDMYTALRVYSQKERYPLEPGNWTNLTYEGACGVINQFLDEGWYQRAPDWSTIAFDSPLTQEKVDLYHLARHRKLRLINYMMEYAKTAYYVIGVDDASPKNTIQSNDINFIKTRMNALGVGYSLFADTDSAALMALARCAVDEYSGGVVPKAYVEYFGNRVDDPADQYDIGTLRENVESHITCMGATQISSSSETHDLQVLVLTRIGDDDATNTDLEPTDDYKNATDAQKATYESNVNALVDRVNQNLANDIPTIVLDCSACYLNAFNDGAANLQEALLQNGTDIGRLLGYSNWNTVGNTLGIGLGQGMSRYAYLNSNVEKTAEASIAAAQSIIYSYVKDIAYVARHKSDSKTWMFKYKLFRDDNVYTGSKWVEAENRYLAIWYDVNGNMYQEMLNYAFSDYTARDYEFCNTERYLCNWLDWEMQVGDGDASTYADSYLAIVNVLQEDSIYTDLVGDTSKTQGIGAIELSNFRMPWYRIFEITFNIAVELDDVYTYSSDNLVSVPLGTTVACLIEDVKADHTANTATTMFGTTQSYTDYRGAAFTFPSAGPAIYTDATIATVTMTSGDDAAVSAADSVGTGFKVTVSGITYETVVAGDTTGDGNANTLDVRNALSHIIGDIEYSNAQVKAADRDDNGKVSSIDARRMLQDLLNY